MFNQVVPKIPLAIDVDRSRAEEVIAWFNEKVVRGNEGYLALRFYNINEAETFSVEEVGS